MLSFTVMLSTKCCSDAAFSCPCKGIKMKVQLLENVLVENELSVHICGGSVRLST